jgi:hypothetical protein
MPFAGLSRLFLLIANMLLYVVKYRAGGRQRWFTIGRHGSPWTPEAARREAIRLLGEVVRGLDPAEKRNVDRKAVSFAELCDVYLAEGVAHKKASTLRVDRGRIELHLKPLLGGKRADAITRADIERLLNDVKKGRTAAQEPHKRPPGGLAQGGAGVCRPMRRLGFHGPAICRGSRHSHR